MNKVLYDGYQRHLHDCANSVRAAEFVHGLQKAVTALPPADAEQLVRLREDLRMRTFCPSCDHDYCQMGHDLLVIIGAEQIRH